MTQPNPFLLRRIKGGARWHATLQPLMLQLLFALSLAPIASGTFGGCCGMAPPPPPCPPPMCAPPPPPCPPPPICPPQFCPPPAPCPPPPPPPPPPMCPPPPPPQPIYQSPCQSYAPAPVFSQYVQQPANDCCCRCGSPCRFRARHRTHGSKIFSAASVEIEEQEATCSSKKLKAVMEDNIAKDPSISKRAIQKAAEEKLFGKFNVICAKGDFSYVAYTETFCQLSNDDVTCYAFRPM